MKNGFKNKQASFKQKAFKHCIALLLGILSSFFAEAQVSLTATSGTATGSFTTISDAFAAINAGTHKGVIVITVTNNTTEPTTVTPLYGSGTASASSSSYTSVLIKPSGGSWTINSAATPSANRAVVELAGADSVTIDGDPTSSGTRSLTIAVATSTNVTAALRISSNSTAGSDGAINITVKNCTLLGSRPTFSTTTASYGISLSNYSTTSLTGGAYANDRVTIQNNIIRRAHSGIYAVGTSTTYPNTNYKILNNIIGSSTASDIIGQYGIFLTYTGVTTGTNNGLIEGNDIQLGDYATGYSTSVFAIYVSSYNYGLVIRKNNIHDIAQSSSSGYGALGIYILSSLNNDIKIENNFIRDITANAYSTSRTTTLQNHGIFISSVGTGLKINNNTVYLNKANATSYSSGSLASTAASSCITLSSATPAISQFMNNLLINNQGSVSSNAYCIVTSGTANLPSTTNNNSYYTPSGGKIGYYNATDYSTLSAWQSATGLDYLSVNENPTFTSTTDLHIPAGTSTLIESGGASTATTGVTDDIDNQTRPGISTYGFGTAPDIGADEFNGQVVYTCTTPVPGATIKSPTTICLGKSMTLSLTTATSGTGVKYQWQTASSSSGPWTDMTGLILATATVTPTAYEFYRCKVKCLAGPDSTYSTPVQVAYTNSVATTTSGSRCGTGTVSLAATAASATDLNWYDVPTGGTSLGTGASFSTPSITSTSTFYVANEAISSGTMTIGTGTVSSSGTGSSPFSQGYESNHSQYLVLASDLIAGGLKAGNITALSIPVLTKSSSMKFYSFTIKMAHTTVTTLTTSTILSPTFTTVYGPDSINTVLGANNFSFPSSSYFNWDGSSNIVIDICFDNDPTSIGILYTSNDAVTATTKSYTAVVGMYKDNATLCGATTGGTFVSTTSLPNFTFTGNVPCFCSRVPLVATVNTPPSAPTVTTPINYCVGSTPSVLTATGTGLKWYTTATGGIGSTTAPTPSTATAGTTNYYVSQTNSTTLCESSRALIEVTVNPLPSAPTVSTPINYCIGSAASALTATGTSLKWYTVATGGTSSSTAPTPSTATVGTVNYYVSQTDGLSCESPRALIAVITNSILPAPTVTTPVNICLGATTTALTATGTGLTWYTTATGGTGSSTAPIPSSAATGTTNYYVSQSASGACEGPRALIAAQVNPLPTAPTVTTPVTYCQNITATALTATGTSLKWYTVATGGTGSTTAPIPSTVAAGITSYYVSQTNTFVCEGPRALINVTVNPAPALPTITTPVVYCQNSIASALTATGTSLKWYTVATGGTGSTTAPTPSTSIATTLNFYVTQSNTTTLCESPRANLVVTVNPQPAAPTITSPIAYCQNATTATALSATGTSLLWYTTATGGTGSSTAPTPATTTVGATNNYVTQTNSFSCESPRANLVVNINPLPAAPTVSSPLNLCIGSVALPLTATGTSLQWYSLATGGTSSTAAPTPSTTTLGATDYYVSQTNTFVCEGPRAKLTVQVQPLPVVSISSLASSGFIFCRYQSITLKANAPTATNYQWSFNDSNLIGAIANTIAANTTGYYKVDVKDVYGCKNKDSVWAQRDTSVVPTLTPSNIKICKEGSELLFVNPGYASWSFNWQMGGAPLLPAMPTSNLRNVNASGVYSVITTNSFGCLDTTNNATISYHSAPIKPTISNVAPLLSISKSYNYYQWYKNNVSIVGANSSSYKVTAKGSYHVEVTDENGCLNQSDTVKILSTTGIESAIKNELKIYPNPTRNIVKIDAPIKVNVKVTDIVGKLVLEAKDTKEINLEQFADGTYLLVITDEENNMITIEKIHKIN